MILFFFIVKVVQATGPQKRTSSSSKHDISPIKKIFGVIFAPSPTGSRTKTNVDLHRLLLSVDLIKTRELLKIKVLLSSVRLFEPVCSRQNINKLLAISRENKQPNRDIRMSRNPFLKNHAKEEHDIQR